MVDELRTPGDRIKYIREMLNLSQQDFANNLSLKSRQSIHEYEKNISEPNVTTINLIAIMGNCTTDWVLRGIGEKPRIGVIAEPKNNYIDKSNIMNLHDDRIELTTEESELIQILRKIPDMIPVVKKLVEGKLKVKEALNELDNNSKSL